MESEGDWYALKEALYSLNRKLSGINAFDSEKERLNKKLLEPEVSKLVKAGKEYADLRKRWLSRKTAGTRKKIEKFIEGNQNLYGEKAKGLIN